MSPQPDLVIANATVVNSFGRRIAHIVVRDGVVTQLLDATEPAPRAVRTIDATGMLVIPGGVDGHCHVAQVTGRFRTLDDYRTTSTAALWGGTTTIIDFGIPRTPRKRRSQPCFTRRSWPPSPGATSPSTALSSAGTKPCRGSSNSSPRRVCAP